MSNFVTGLIAVGLISLFLVFYAVKLEAIPLWIIILSVLALVLIDFIQSVRKGKDETKE